MSCFFTPTLVGVDVLCLDIAFNSKVSCTLVLAKRKKTLTWISLREFFPEDCM